MSEAVKNQASNTFCCPRCQGVLRETRGGLTCGGCARDYPTESGIVDLRCGRRDYYFNPVPRNDMLDLVGQAQLNSWDATVRRFLSFVKDVPGWTDNLAVNGRYAWKLLLELSPGSRFLDFGCGLGNLTQNIAPHVGEVVALDLTWERLQFAQQRFAKFNPNDRIILVAGGDGAHLPFPNEYFDCIALSGVLEWIADDEKAYVDSGSRAATALKMLMSFFGETNPRRMQLRFLRELRRILKPDGQLFVAIENRLSYEYFKGYPDHHSGLAYNSLFPRFLANLYSLARSRRPYRTYTYGFNEFRRLFAAAGFPYQEIYGLSPGYSALSEIIPEQTDQLFWSTPRTATVKERMKRSRYFVPAFGAVARSSGDRPRPLIARVLGEIERKLPTVGEIAVDECLVTGKDKVVLRASAAGKEIVLKIPADERAHAGEANNWRVLGVLSRRRTIADIVPKPMAQGIYQGLAYFVESAAMGQPMTAVIGAMTRASAAAKINELLKKMHTPVPPAVSITAASEPYASLVAKPVAKLRTTAFDPLWCDRLERYFRRGVLTGQQWAVGLYHGDFTVDNIFVSNGEISGVIDWEYSTEQGLPALDAIGYVECVQRIANPQTTATENLMRLSRWDWPLAEEIALLRAVYRYFQVDPKAHELLCRLCWLHYVAHQLDTNGRFNPSFIERSVRPMLGTLTDA